MQYKFLFSIEQLCTMKKSHPVKGNFNKKQKSTIQSGSQQANQCSQDTITREKNFTKLDSYRFSELDSYICIPISIDKKPAVSWKNVKETPKHLFHQYHNIAILTGLINGITVIDIDIPKTNKNEKDGMVMMKELCKIHNGDDCIQTPICRTQSGGLHFYFKYDPEIKTTTGVNGYSIDVRNDCGLIVAPPSVGERGPYEWINESGLSDIDPIEIPKWLKEWLLLAEKNKNVKTTKVGAKKEIDEKSYNINKDYIFIYDNAKITDLLNKLPEKYLNNYKDWLTITSCLKSEGLYDIWDTWSKQSTNYDKNKNIEQWNSFVPKLNINYLSYLAKTESIDVEPYIIKSTKKINFMNYKPDVQINKRYIDKNDIIIDNNNMNNIFTNTAIVKSGCGTGKTTFACLTITDLTKNNDYRFISVSVRISLAYQQAANFAKNKLIVSNYKTILNNAELNKQKNLVIQVDSLVRINTKSWDNTIIYLDEISCLFSYILTSTTLNAKRMVVFNTLCDLLTKASKILVTDADVNDMVLMFFDKINIKYHLIENTYTNPIKTPAYEYNSKEVLLNKIEQQFLTPKRVFVCFDSKKEMDIVVQRMKTFCEVNGQKKRVNNFMVYSATEGDSNDFLCVDDRWKDKDVFITPKVVNGVDLNNKIPRDVYLIAKGNSINAVSFVQQASRCRNINELHYYVANKYQPLKYKSVDDVKEHFKGIIQQYDSLCCLNSGPKPKNKSTKFNKSVDIDVGDVDEIDIDDINKAETTFGKMYSKRSDYMKLKTIVDSGNASRNFMNIQGGNNWTLHETLFNEMFFYNEYYDNVLRSAPREQFRMLLEGKNYEIIYNNEEIDNDDKKIVVKNNKNAKIQVEDNYDQLCQRALYNRVNSLTENEKKIHDDAERRAKFLKIDFNKKVQKKKWEKFLISDVEFSRHIAYRLLIGDEAKLDSKIAASLEKDYKITICNSLEVKIKLIKKVEKILGVECLDINTQRDIDRFDEEIVIDDDTLKLLKKTFRINKANSKIADKFENLYYELIQLYKHVLGNDICRCTRNMIDNVRHYFYIINLDVVNEHIKLTKL